eukprot:5797251-Karenia_brevis.AAC.1
MRPLWYNDPACGCVGDSGTQMGATCGLFAVNHILAGAAALLARPNLVLHMDVFENAALAANFGVARRDLIDPAGANYDISVLNINLQSHGLRTWPMSPG